MKKRDPSNKPPAPKPRPWFIETAKDALEEGYRVIADRLNQVLSQVAPGVQIDADPLRPGDSLHRAAQQFRATLPALRVHAPFPANDSQVPVWTYGYINGSNNAAIFVCADDPMWIDALDSTCELLLQRQSWAPEHWREWIKTPVEEQQRQWLEFLAQLEDAPPTAADNANKSPPKHPDSADVRDLCSLLAKHRDRIAQGKTSAIGVAREFTGEFQGEDPKATNLLRQARRFRHLWK